VRPDPRDVARAAAMIAHAKRPLLLVGGGIHLSQAYGELAEFAEGQNIPVAHTLSGKGAIACTHALSAGLFGRYHRIANDLICEADLLIVVGCKLGEIAAAVANAGKTSHSDRCCRREMGNREFCRQCWPGLNDLTML
jgi:acetolactate synthase-1/2/3 large subunit